MIEITPNCPIYSEEIKPCPICGGAAFPVYWTGDWVCIGCSECGERTIWYNDPEQAIEAWNGKKSQA